MHGEQMTQPCMAQCITMPKMRGPRPSHMHSISMAKGQQQQPDEESGRRLALRTRPDDVA